MTDLDRLKTLLKDLELSQNDLALKLGVSKQFINQILISKKKLSSKLLNKLREQYPDYFDNPYNDKLEFPKIVTKEFIEKFRKHYGYSKIQISNYLGISHSLYSFIINNKQNITSNLVERLKLLNENPNQQIDLSLVEKSKPIKINYYQSLKDFNSKHARTLYIDKLFLSNRNTSESNITCLKIDSSHESFNVLIDTSNTILETDKKYLIEHNNEYFLCSIIKKNKIKCTSIFANKDTFYFGNSDRVLGELIGFAYV